ncbi:glycoside hydrolase family 2 TIM barrel-domain containing protein [Polaribacter undariae]|uniref:Glycoside hydrolase family 2 TIM barrel-domain containing protein n=1 Tax=Polaribacter sejongensis TaxID=985043 RepID=A0AAJ1VH94_9FLAO|nr:glycoside hydrolase family 2 TIM barrel-domain containing protein [Polaribacter undariae]MDN3620099.1 glycoside hydrolase family 2 TIM barrel-domain containing protein [Polaribacter undariae]UWD32246.1 beta galactosidase jelly roll domain-containing protein [Polaribacter undariae]
MLQIIKRKELLSIITFCTIFINVFAQKTIQNNSSREKLSLNGEWNYIIDPYQMGYLDYRLEPFDMSKTGKGGFYENITNPGKSEKVEYDFDSAPTLTVPGDWNSQKEKLEFYEGTLWYKRDFVINPEKDKRYFIHFGAVNYESNIYLNGKKIGSHKGGFTPFQFEVTNKLNTGDNFIVLMVDNTRKVDEIPTINTDWWNYGGITRDVSILETPQNFISDYKVQLAKDENKIIEGYIQIDNSKNKETVSLEIPELKIKKEYKVDENGFVKFSIPTKKISYWSPENPKLYEVSISSDQEKITDKIGFRTIKTVGKDIFLNGNSIFLKGISLHDENPLIKGRLRSEADMRMLLTWAKELGCNYVRLAHYTHDEKMLRLADEMGLMVWAEVPVYWTISWTNAKTYKNAANQLEVGIERDKNRASVIIWSIGNETPVTEPRNVFMGNLVDKVRSIDNTRLVAAALEVEREGYTVVVDDPLGDKIDLASFNEYGGWYWGKPEELDKYEFHIKFDKPVVISEFGAGALAGYHGDKDTMWSEEHQEAIYINQIKMLEKIDGFRGMTPWILVDFRSPRRQNPVYQDFWNRKGLISNNGVKKKAFYVLKAYYESKK